MNGHSTFLAGVVVALAGGWILLPRAFYRTTPQPLQFSHRLHTSESVGMACDDCHAFTGEGRFTGIPSVARCAECHEEPVGETANERRLIEDYVKTGREIPWLVYARQPDNVYFPHVQHVNRAGFDCAACHGPHGTSDRLRPYRVDRLSGYSRDLSARSLGGVPRERTYGLRMDDCFRCHTERKAALSCLACHK